MLPLRTRTLGALTIGAGIALIATLALSSSDANAKHRKRRAPRDAGVESSAQTADAAQPRPAIDASRPTPPASSSRLCYYGSVIDGHTGRERCLAPEELDPPLHVHPDTRALADQLGMLHGPEPASPDAGPIGDAEAPADDAESDGGDEGTASGAFKARVVSVSFENGVIGRAHRSLKRVQGKMAECVDKEGGLKSQSARLKLLFLVRAQGRAEGLIVASSRNIPPKVVRCITKTIEHLPVGAPSNDPVGVTALIELKEREPDPSN